MIKRVAHMVLRPKGKYSFIHKFCKGNVLDIGSGKSPNRIKKLFPNCYYVGLDINSHYKDNDCMADNYVITNVNDFPKKLLEFDKGFDCVISSHNLEHCDDREGILKLSARTVKPGGFFYLSFPSEKTVNFPKGRFGTLNYYDDETHKYLPPSVSESILQLSKEGFSVVYKEESYRPILLWTLGLVLEPLSRLMNKNLVGTLQFYGFESILWLQRDQL